MNSNGMHVPRCGADSRVLFPHKNDVKFGDIWIVVDLNMHALMLLLITACCRVRVYY
jgi:hypothetical protein